MIALPPRLRAALRANDSARRPGTAPHPALDPLPVVKVFNPLGPARWFATQLAEDGNTLFGLADLGFGSPELGYFSLSVIAALRLPFGRTIERDLSFQTVSPPSVWAKPPEVSAMRSIVGMAAEGETARRADLISSAEWLLQRAASTGSDPDLPPSGG